MFPLNRACDMSLGFLTFICGTQLFFLHPIQNP